MATIFASPNHRKRPAVLNLSLGFPPEPPPGVNKKRDYKVYERQLRYVIVNLQHANILVVAAIGNEGDGKFRLPAAYPDVVGVGAVGNDGKVAGFSGGGVAISGKPDVVGYGVSINSSVERDADGSSYYAKLSGTSMASPYVAGIATLYRMQSPGEPMINIISKLEETALPLDGQPAERVGAGLARFVPER